MKKISVSTKMLFIGFLFAACNNSETSTSADVIDRKPTFDLTVAKTEIEEANKHFMDVLSKSDSIGLANCYTVDGKFMAPNAPAVEGRENIQHEIAGLINAGATQIVVKIINL